jgi:hypothetical protein
MDKVTYSVALAIRFMLDIAWHGESYVREKCPALKPVVWCNFLFFRRIRPLPIRRIKRLEPTLNERAGSWVVERDVEFYIRNLLIGVVTLRGEKIDRMSSNVRKAREYGLDVGDVHSMWAVSHVWYYRSVSHPDGLEERIETDVPYSGYSSGQI